MDKVSSPDTGSHGSIRRIMDPRRVRKALNGVLPVLKPHGITSAQLLNQLKEKLQEELSSILPAYDVKLGHGGTLDSTATGVITVGVGTGCQQLQCLLHGEKSYLAKCQLGVATDTYNENGKITMMKQFEHVTEDALQERLRQFQGRIKQIPPPYSALKCKGRRYSDLAMKGVNFTIEPRLVHCYELKLKSFEPPYFTVSVDTGPGFYVRSLINDLGLAVGSCAHVCELQRTKQGPFTLYHSLHKDQWTLKNVIQNIIKFRKTINIYYRNFELDKKGSGW